MYRDRGYYRFQRMKAIEKKEKRAWQVYGTESYDIPNKNDDILNKNKKKELSHSDQKRKDRANYEFEQIELHSSRPNKLEN